ncbi:uncharacterized protein CEXT_347031 [Caerostris extrusa]|uniref:Apple domain-containing protein n=1 Tax=Caerostris extrusa TaxID=172846 RepID=A0AAV4VGG4_CAEEX|nr:uncharacterized protein CEXT_347031 [Caerostris extrusa]
MLSHMLSFNANQKCGFRKPAAEIVPLQNVEHPYTLVEYMGVTAEECGELCVRNVLFPCRSFLSGRLENQLYCGLTHQNREGLVQNQGSLQISRSLNYYEISRSVEVCDLKDLQFELTSECLWVRILTSSHQK